MRIILLLFFYSLTNFCFGVTYTTIGNGNWNNPAIWSPSVPPNPLPVGDDIIINNNVTMTTDITIDGTITISSTGNLIGGNTIIINSGGSFSNSGILNITGDLDVKSGGTVSNSGTIDVDNFINTGVGTNSGTINTINDFDNTDGDFTNTGTINAGDKLTNDNGTFVNSGTITTVDDLENNGGNFTNNGTLDIGDDLENESGGVFVNNGTINIADDLKNDDGNFTNNGTISVVNDLKNDNGTFTENNGTTIGGDVDNQDGTINGTGTLCVNGDLDQDGSGILGGTIDVCNCNNGTNPVINGGTIGVGVTFCATLPITLIDFNAFPERNLVNVFWKTASEVNNDYFVVERSLDAINFNQITTLKGAGNSSVILSYTTVDDEPKIGISYYRLKQVDFDGKYSYSDAKSVLMEGFEFISIVSDEYTGNVIFTLSSSVDEDASVLIFDSAGRLILEHNVQIQKGKNINEIDASTMSNGIYIVIFTSNDGNNVIKQKVYVK